MSTAAGEPLPEPANFNEADVSDKPGYVQAKPLITQDEIDCITRIYRDRLESMRSVDDLVGAVVGTLPADTIIIYVSDNGFLFGEHRLWSKGWVYENSIRVPFHIAGPWTPRTTDALAIMNDLAPTIAELAGVPFDRDGSSLVPLLETEQPWRKRFLIENTVPTQFSALRELDQIFTWYDGGTKERYFLDTDPDQLDSTLPVGGESQILHQQLLRLKQCAGQTCKDEEFAP